MDARLSTKGQLVLPEAIRRKLGLQAGDTFDVAVKDGIITLTPPQLRPRKPRITADSLTGLPVLNAGADAPVLTSKSVRAILDETP